MNNNMVKEKIKNNNLFNSKNNFDKLNFISIMSSLVIFFILILLIFLSASFLGLTDRGVMAKIMAMNFLLPKIIINSIASILVIYLLSNYIKIYLQLKSKFTIGLILISITLLSQTLISNPLLINLIGVKGIGMDVLSLISSIFILITAFILIYLQKE
jgi:hypothetical protein